MILTATNGGTLGVKFGDTSANNFLPNTLPNETTVQSFANALGFSGIAQLNQNGAAATVASVDFTQTVNGTISSRALFTGVSTFAQGSTLVSALKDSTNTSIATLAAADTLSVTVGGKTSANLLGINGATAITSTVQSIVDGINNDANIKTGFCQLQFHDGANRAVSSCCNGDGFTD